jgi:hypothetical protein
MFKTRILIVAITLALGPLTASRVMDDETLLRDPDLYSPYPPQDRMVHLTVKKSGVEFCIYKGKWQLMTGNVCELDHSEESLNDAMRREQQRSDDRRAVTERFKKMTPEGRHAFKQKKRRELLSPNPPSLQYVIY